MGVAITLADIAKRGLLGGGSGSSGGGSGGGGSSGGGTTGVSPKEVNFYDYDGTCVYAYSVAEAQALSELPAGPEHPGLVFQGWNWSLEGVKGLTRAMNIGAMYTTDDGTTRLYITLQEGRTSPMLGVGVNGTVTVDWGDGTEPDVLTGTSKYTYIWTPQHAYAKAGNYVIRMTVEGEMTFVGTSATNTNACILRHVSSADVRNIAYQRALNKVEIGNGVTDIHSYAFAQCECLATVSIPMNTNVSADYVFQKCRALKSVTFPDGVTNVGNYACNGCSCLVMAAIPLGTTGIGTYAFNGCYAFRSATLPDSVTNILSSTFVDSGIILATIPGSVSNIYGSTFQRVYGAVYYDFTSHTAVPALSATTAFTGIPADCEIRVPAALYDEWIAATNWSTYADYIKAY